MRSGKSTAAGRLLATLWLVAACAALVPGAGAAPAVLPQQSGTVDLLTQANLRIDGAAADDTFSHAFRVANAGDVNGDGRADVVVGALGASNNGRSRSGSAYVVFGRATTTTVDLASLGTGGFRIDGAVAGGAAGFAVSGAGDVNGDQRADVVVGAPTTTNGGDQNAGSAYVVFGKTSTTVVDLAALGDGGFAMDGTGTQSRIGYSVSGAGDVNGDGRADVVVGSTGAAAYVIFGRIATTRISLSALGTDGFRIVGALASDNAGQAVSGAGDVNADGRADVIVGAPGASNNTVSGSGSAYVVFGKASTTPVPLVSLEDDGAGFRVDGATAGDGAGEAVSGAGDVNGDGRADVLVGARGAGVNDPGAAYVVFGKTSTGGIDLNELADGGFRMDGAAVGDMAGDAVSGVGDVNGDGRPDVLVGAPSADGPRSGGTAYVVFGKATSSAVSLGALGSGGYRIDGAAAGDFVGQDLSGGGDVNGDKRPDVLVSAMADNNGRAQSGSVYLLYGFGEPRLAYDPLAATAGVKLKPHAPRLFERTGPPMFRVTPPLPKGLSLGGLGAVVGTPAAAAAQAQTTHTVTMEDLAGEVGAPLVLTVTPDRIPPQLRIRAAARQRALKQKRILLRVGCSEPCALRLQGAIVIPGSRAIIPLRSANAPKHKTVQRQLSLGLTKAARKRLAGFLARGKRPKAIVSIRARDRAGNRKTNTRGIIVRR
jgi:FG-GAP repeat